MVGVTTTLNFDKPFTGFPYVVAYPVGSLTLIEQVGLTLDGMEQEMVFVLVPTAVPSLVYVVNVSLIETDVPAVFWLAKDSGGVQVMLVLVVNSEDDPATYPEALPQVYCILCLNVLVALLMVNVCAVLRVPLLAVRLDALGIVFSVPEPEPVIVPMLEPLNVIANS